MKGFFERHGVTSSALLGLVSPDLMLQIWLQKAGPVLEILIRFGQLSVAILTALYIFRKWKQLGRKRK